MVQHQPTTHPHIGIQDLGYQTSPVGSQNLSLHVHLSALQIFFIVMGVKVHQPQTRHMQTLAKIDHQRCAHPDPIQYCSQSHDGSVQHAREV